MSPHPHRSAPARGVLAPVAALAALVLVLLTPGAASALPTASFTFTPGTPAVGEPVSFTFTGTCDDPPCRIEWRWFRTGGSHLGTTMGEGELLDYAFPASGSYAVVVKITNAGSTHGSATATQDIVVEDTYQDTDPRVVLGGWQGVASATATRGGYRLGTTSARLVFHGRQVRYVGVTGPDRGIAQLRVDGRRAGAVDLYSARPGTRTHAVAGLGRGRHLITVRATGRAAPASRGTAVSLDELVVGLGRHVDDASLRVQYAGWRGHRVGPAPGSSVRTSGRRGDTARVTFTGTSLTWRTATGPDQGRARLEVDGRTVTTVDNWSVGVVSGVARTVNGLSAGPHTARVVVLGRHRPASTGSLVVLDAFVVH